MKSAQRETHEAEEQWFFSQIGEKENDLAEQWFSVRGNVVIHEILVKEHSFIIPVSDTTELTEIVLCGYHKILPVT